nr:MAG TPA: hypothetical protein [Caudoviricetes sp.]
MHSKISKKWDVFSVKLVYSVVDGKNAQQYDIM